MEHSLNSRPVKNGKVQTRHNWDAALAWTQTDWLLAAGLFVLGLLSRLPFAGQVLYHWDSINFAYALQRFDIANGQPHVPGYILYVYLGRAVNLIFNDAQTSLVAISMVSSGLALVFLYRLGSEMFHRRIGLAAALFLWSSPLFWFYGEIALPHTLDALVVIVLVWLLYRVAAGDLRWTILAAIWLGIAGGFRPQTQVFMAPLALYAGWRLGWRRGLAAVAVLAAVDFVWFIPLVQNTGGLASYLDVMGAFSAEFNTTTTIFSAGLLGLTRNLRKLVMYTAYGWGLAAIPAGLALLIPFWNPAIRQKLKASLRGNPLRHIRFWFFVLWMGPTVVFYALIHMGQQGLVFVYLPALMLLSAVGLFELVQSLVVRRVARVLLAGTTALVGANALIFLAAPTYPLDSESPKLLTVETLDDHDDFYLQRIQAIPQNFDQQSTILLSSEWRFPQYYLSQYELQEYAIGARWEVGEGLPGVAQEAWRRASDLGLHPDSQGYLYLVILDEELLPYNDSDERQEQIVLLNNESIQFVRFSSQEWLYLGTDSYGVAPAFGSAP